MGGAGPYVTFDCSPLNLLKWQRQSRLKRRREDILRYWNLAQSWIVGEHGLIDVLLQDDEWENTESTLGCLGSERHVDQAMFTVAPKDPAVLGSMFAFQLPKSILQSWLPSESIEFDAHDAAAMKHQFESRLFRGKRDNKTWGVSDSYVQAPEPLSDIFYLLQCMIPGILTITREEDPDDKPEFINARGLPRQEWLSKNKTVLQHVFDEDQFDEIFKAAGDVKRAYICRHLPHYSDQTSTRWMEMFV